MNGLFALLAELNRPESVELFRELTQRLPTVTPPLNPFTADPAALPPRSADAHAASGSASFSPSAITPAELVPVDEPGTFYSQRNEQ
jgi:hypothetical protein